MAGFRTTILLCFTVHLCVFFYCTAVYLIALHRIFIALISLWFSTRSRAYIRYRFLWWKSMADQRKSAPSDNDINSMTDNDLHKFELAVSNLQSLQLNGERLLWTSDLESLKNFVEKCLNLQGKWTSPGGNSKQFKSSSNNLIMTWYSRKQLTLAFQGPGGSYFKSKLVDLVLNKKARADSSDLDPSTTTEQENSPLLEA